MVVQGTDDGGLSVGGISGAGENDTGPVTF